MTTEDVLSHFGTLDELIQIIYEGIERFVLLSSIDDISQEWIVHLGLQGPEGRWWRGSWSDKDILRLTVSSTSSSSWHRVDAPHAYIFLTRFHYRVQMHLRPSWKALQTR